MGHTSPILDFLIVNTTLKGSFTRELKQATFLTTRTLTGSKFDVFDQPWHLLQSLWRPRCQKRRLLKLSIVRFFTVQLSIFLSITDQYYNVK